MAKREFLMLAHEYDPKKHDVIGWYMSEKLDGQRCFWDGGITTGIAKSQVPWANCAKDGRYKNEQIATGLWTRYGNVIHAPYEFIRKLPKGITLDGELWQGRQSRQSLFSIIKKLTPEPADWQHVQFMVFDSPPYVEVFGNGEINTTNFKIKLDGILEKWQVSNPVRRFAETLTYLRANYIDVLDQVKIEHLDQMWEALSRVNKFGGEGLILRSPDSLWLPQRSHYLLKVKSLSDMEGIVIGYTTGRATELGSKLLGKMGALILRLDSGVEFELSGFTDEERELNDPDWARVNPHTRCMQGIYALKFPLGSRVTFKYRELSRDGVPVEARYWRAR